MSTDTPETDAMERDLYERQPSAWEVEQTRLGLCRKLEREKNAMQAEARKYITLWDQATKDLETLKFGPETP